VTKIQVAFTVNGEPREILVQPWQTLLEAIRDELRLTGTKEGCGNGNCGACTIIIGDRAIDSCCMLAAEAEGQKIITIEGLARNGELDPLQKAFIRHGALQCGFCTPGFLLSARAFLDKNKRPSEHDIRMAIAGNLCRCTGYDKIVRAIQDVAQQEE
jgi:carbon-monoxide dehydrogenase small subunit